MLDSTQRNPKTGTSSAGAKGVFGFFGGRGGIAFEFVEQFLDGAVELGVFAFGHQRWIIDDCDVGIDAVAFDNPITLSAINAKGRDADRAIVDQAGRASHADQTAPGAGTD